MEERRAERFSDCAPAATRLRPLCPVPVHAQEIRIHIPAGASAAASCSDDRDSQDLTSDSRGRCDLEHVMQPSRLGVAHCALVREIVPVVNVNCRAYLVAELVSRKYEYS